MNQQNKNTSSKQKTVSRSLVVKSNDLINARFNLSVAETRIILLMVAQINMDDEDFKTYKVRIKDFMESAGISSNTKNVYSRAREYTKKLMKRVLEIPKEDGTWLQVSFISSAEYPAGRGYVELQFDPKLKPYLIKLKQRFTTYEAQNVLSLGSFYSIRLYELLKQYEKIGKRTIGVDELKDLLGILDSYKSYYLFKQRVIEQAKKELDENCDITFSYKEIRMGRKVVEIEFNIIRQPDVFDTRNDSSEIITSPLLDDKNTILTELQEIGFTKSQVEKSIEKYKDQLDELGSLIQSCKAKHKSGKIENLAAYIWDVVKVGGKVKPSEKTKTKSAEKKKKLTGDEQSSDEKKIIAEWEKEYESAIAENNEKYADESSEYLLKFEEYVRKNMGLRIMLIKEGKLNKKHSMFRYMLGSFIAESLEKNLPEFPKWVQQVKGYHIIEDKGAPGSYRINAKQASLFK
ncbi:replication initiation protein [Chondrinema litorale]|uniref:replication initiation protein n=1 Tax=Chondrinema litorale TaxID=2994555 RepID=UPI0025428BFE|nr:replication initiation protein [Chondrinema litorale]UZR99809.1 replication initiation protein [Chondrinema litorale]